MFLLRFGSQQVMCVCVYLFIEYGNQSSWMYNTSSTKSELDTNMEN